MEKKPHESNEANGQVRLISQNASYYGQLHSFNNGNSDVHAPNAGLKKELLISELKENINKPPPLGLRLQETTIKAIRDTMNAILQERSAKNSARAPSIAKLSPADLIPATLLKIGKYNFAATQKDTLIVGFYYATQKLAWEIFYVDHRMKFRIEVLWQDILTMRVFLEENKIGILEIELAKAPTFFQHIDPYPDSHPKWDPSNDFTGGHALIYRRHYFEFCPEVLGKYYQKLIQSHNRLSELSRLPFPCLISPYFDPCLLSDQTVDDSFHDHHMWRSQINPYNCGCGKNILPISPQQTEQSSDNAISCSSAMDSNFTNIR